MKHIVHSDALLVVGTTMTLSGVGMAALFGFVGWYLAPDVALHTRIVAPINGGLYLSVLLAIFGLIALLVYRHGEAVWID